MGNKVALFNTYVKYFWQNVIKQQRGETAKSSPRYLCRVTLTLLPVLSVFSFTGAPRFFRGFAPLGTAHPVHLLSLKLNCWVISFYSMSLAFCEIRRRETSQSFLALLIAFRASSA